MMLLVPLQFFTGLVLWDVTRFAAVVELLGGLRVVDTIHVLLFIVFSGFIIVHVYLGSLGHTRSAHFKAMLTGWEDVEDGGSH
jgi:thiosulfate reductase cytochrome b subunit